ncbi:uncharacterized protein [Choristoneura fumiferana]|uniref:uncharacterized protein n=1 Tax=Choristoneura fumiferana TaxID=7141 RepID=UPI003D15CD2B
MNNQKPPKKDVSIFQEKTSRFKQKPSSIFKKIPRMEIKPSNNWRILKIGPSSKRIKKRKKMSDFATSRKYLDNLRRIEFDTNYHPVAIPFKPMEDKGNSNEPIIIEDEEDEESSDCESEHKKRLIDALYSLMQRVEQISLKSQRKPRESTLKDEQMQENKAEKENPREQNLPKDLEVVPSPQRPVSIESSTLNTNVLYEKPQIPQTNTENTLKEHFDQSDPIQNIPNPLAFENKFNALRTLLVSPIAPPKKRYKHYEPQTIVRKTTGGVPMDLSCSSHTVRPPNVLRSEIQFHQPSGSHENRIHTNLDINPHAPDYGEFSGGHSSFQQVYPLHVENNTKLTTQSTLSLESGSSQSAQKTQESSVVKILDPIIPVHNTNQNTSIETLTCPQHFQQFNEGPPTQSQNPLTQENLCNPEQHPQIVAKYIFQQFYSQNNASSANPGQNHLQSAFLQPHPFLLQQGNLNEHLNQNLQTEGYPPELLYWAQIGMGMWARENMTQVIPSAINHPILYPPYQVPFSDQDMQALQITPDVNIVEQNQSVIENTLDSVQLESVQNPTELNLLPENINELDSAPRTIDIPTETPTVTNDIEQNTEIRMDKPTTSQNSEGALNVSANPENFTEFIRELDDLLEQLKSSTKAINNQLNNRSLFNTSEIMDEVMNGVHGYCTQRDTNVSASRSQGATAANQRVKKREHRNTSVDSNNDICYDDDVMDEDYRTDTDEEDDSDRKPKRKRIRISFDLPPEYDPDDSRWCLKYRGEGLGVKEIMPNSNVYVNERQVMNCKRVAKTSNALATMLLVEIFSYNALIVCSLTGSKATSYQVEGDKVRPGLDKNARETLLAYVEQHEEEMKWPKVSRQRILDSLRFKLKRMREDALKFNE